MTSSSSTRRPRRLPCWTWRWPRSRFLCCPVAVRPGQHRRARAGRRAPPGPGRPGPQRRPGVAGRRPLRVRRWPSGACCGTPGASWSTCWPASLPSSPPPSGRPARRLATCGPTGWWPRSTSSPPRRRPLVRQPAGGGELARNARRLGLLGGRGRSCLGGPAGDPGPRHGAARPVADVRRARLSRAGAARVPAAAAQGQRWRGPDAPQSSASDRRSGPEADSGRRGLWWRRRPAPGLPGARCRDLARYRGSWHRGRCAEAAQLDVVGPSSDSGPAGLVSSAPAAGGLAGRRPDRGAPRSISCTVTGSAGPHPTRERRRRSARR